MPFHHDKKKEDGKLKKGALAAYIAKKKDKKKDKKHGCKPEDMDDQA